MPLTTEQIKELKKQLSEQIKNLPEEQKKEAQRQIDAMSSDALETMLKQQQAAQNGSQKIFRAIVSGEIPSHIIDQNEDAIAVLSTKSISNGHIIIIPKKEATDVKQIPKRVLALTKKISETISEKLKASSCEIQTELSFGEIIIHIIPVYDKPLNLNSPRKNLSEKELEETYRLLKVEKKPEVIKIRKKKQTKIIKLKRRIP